MSDGSGPTLVGSWEAEGTDLAAITAAVDGLRHQGEHLATRTSVVNLVVVADDERTLGRTAAAMRRLGARHPGRTVLVRPSPEPSGSLGASVELWEAVAAGHAIWWEELSLTVGGDAAAHLDSLLTPLVVRHLPVAAWFPGVLPRPGDPLAAMADAVLVDSRFAEPLGAASATPRQALVALTELARRHPVVDLSWKRTSPWRELLAALFEPPQLRGFQLGVAAARLAGQPGPRRLLAGWVADRLNLAEDIVATEDAVHASIELDAVSGGRRGRFVVRRVGDEPLVDATAEVDGEQLVSLRRQLPEHGLTWSLAQALSRLERERIYEHALRRVLGWRVPA